MKVLKKHLISYIFCIASQDCPLDSMSYTGSMLIHSYMLYTAVIIAVLIAKHGIFM